MVTKVKLPSGKVIDLDTPWIDKYKIKVYSKDYYVGMAYSYLNKEKNKKKKKYANDYVKFIEGKRSEPNFNKYGITTKQAQNVRNRLSSYKNEMFGLKPNVYMIPR